MPGFLYEQKIDRRSGKKAVTSSITIFTLCCLAAAVLILAGFYLYRQKNAPEQFPLRAGHYNFYKIPDVFGEKLAQAAESLTRDRVVYDPAYFVLKYPGGDAPKDRGVCSDVVVRAYRKLGIDLQVEVHEDMERAWDSYPRLWGNKRPDPNIDHRRVFNLMAFFSRHGQTLPVSAGAAGYKPGDIVIWRLHGGRGHIGVVSNRVNKAKTRYLLAHNIGRGQVLDDVLFNWPIIGHFSYGK